MPLLSTARVCQHHRCEVHRAAALHMQMRCVGARVGTDVEVRIALCSSLSTSFLLNLCYIYVYYSAS